MAINKAMLKNMIAIPKPIHSGLNTHHQLQSITLVNFNTTKATVNKPLNPIPLDDEDELLLILFLL